MEGCASTIDASAVQVSILVIMVRHFQEEPGNPASLPDLPKAVKVLQHMMATLIDGNSSLGVSISCCNSCKAFVLLSELNVTLIV